MKHDILDKFSQKDNFYVRIREGKSSEVYYNGIEPFKISNNKLKNINEDLFVFNSTNIKNSIKNNNKDDLIKCLKYNRNVFYDLFEVKSINFEKGAMAFKNEEKFNNVLKELGAVEVKNNRYEINIKNLSIEDEYSLLKTIWIDYKKGRSNLFRDVRFDLNKLEKELTLQKIKKEDVINLIKDYFAYTKIEKEKYYQHLFLLDKDEKSLRKKIMFFNNDVKPFEEEYYIAETKDGDGRIDCIFYKEMDGYVTDIYMIEIKVDTGVIGGTNGLHKHLLDILHINDMSKDKDFYGKIIDRINYRNEEKLKVAENLEKHFFIVIGRSNSSLEKVKKAIRNLNDETSSLYIKVKEKIDEKYKNKVEPLNKIYEKCLKDVDVKLFVDQTKWNVSDNFKPNYEDFTKWLKDEK